MVSELTPEVLAQMRERAAYWGPPPREQCVGEDHMARDVLELLDEIDRLRTELTAALLELAMVREKGSIGGGDGK